MSTTHPQSQTYVPVANSVAPQQVRETDEAYIIEDVPFVRPMELAGGYVPEFSVRETAAAWDGVPATLNHPRDEAGRPVAANEQPETHLGTTEDPHYDGEYVRGNIRLEKERLEALAPEANAIERALASGDPVDVSSQYAARPLPPGTYDGAHREEAEEIVRPDSVAILPNTTGVCSIEDGCGINPRLAANAAVTVPMRANETREVAGVRFSGTATGELDESAIDKAETDLSDHYLYGEGEDKADFSYPVVDAQGRLRRGNVDAAHQLGCRGQCDDAERHDERLRRLAAAFDDPPAWADETMSGNTPTPNADAQFATGDLVSWEWSGGTAQGRVAEVFVDEGVITRTFDGTEVTKDSDEAPVYLVDVWRDGAYDGQALRQQGERDLSAWDDPPEEAMSSNAVSIDGVPMPERYVFDNPGEAVEAAEELGFTEGPSDERIHTHGEGDDTVFMPGPSHGALVKRLREMGELDAASVHGGSDDDMSGNAVREAFRTLRQAVLGATDDGATPEDSPNNTPGSTTANDAGDGTDGVDRAALIDDITSNSPLTEAALEARCNDGLQAIHADVMAAADDAPSADGESIPDSVSGTSDADVPDDTTDSSDPDTMSDDPIELDDLSDDARDALVDEAVERIEANREDNQKEELATEIIANSADYDSDDRETLLDTPLSVLEDIHANATATEAGVPGGGLSGNASVPTGDDDVDAYPDGVMH